MRILFVLRHPLYLRNFEAPIRLLAERGHSIHLAFSPIRTSVDDSLAKRLSREFDSITYERVDDRKGMWVALSDAIRRVQDYLRYLDPVFAKAPKLARRARKRIPRIVAYVLERVPGISSPSGRAGLARFLRLIERALPCESTSYRLVRRCRPDLFLVTPLVDMTYHQTEYLKSAKALGIPTVLCVASWDNLTNKGLIQIEPDLVIVWNEIQRREAIELHDISATKVKITGAQLYDQWFDAKPSSTREAFCQRVGLDPTKLFLLYVCSSYFIAPRERRFVARWLERLRTNTNPRLREAGVLIRPHPASMSQWTKTNFAELGNVTVWPRGGHVPVDESSKAEYFDSIFHSSAVAGINTSAFIEAAVVGRPVYTLLDEDFVDTQDGTLHFHYLRDDLLQTSTTIEDHLDLLSEALEGEGLDVPRNQRFLEAFVRPKGLAVPASPEFANVVEEAGDLDPAPAIGLPVWGAGLRLPLIPLALAASAYNGLLRRARAQQLGRRAARWSFRGLVFLLTAVRLKEPVRRHLLPYLLPRLVAALAGDRDSDGIDAVIAGGMHRSLRSMERRDDPIIVGPWLSEVGFEVLYWIPFLRWAVTKYGLHKERIIVVSRGGAEIWYQDLCGRYIDALDFFTVDEFRARNEERWSEIGGQKQAVSSEFDRDILALAVENLGLDNPDVLHPSLMFNLLKPCWHERGTLEFLRQHTLFQQIPRIDDQEVLEGLPNDYIALRFYFNESFPNTSENRSFVTRLIKRLTREIDVVLLNTGFEVDDHADFDESQGRRIHRVSHLMEPRNNLEIQTRIISRARAFVGTYGGLSYLGPFCGVPSVGFYSEAGNFVAGHLDVARRAYRDIGGTFITLDVRDVELLEVLFADRRTGGTHGKVDLAAAVAK